ncbi:serine hydrolase domain-containing protein [Erythrobacter rubeus]|uniref:Beta-lactamase family protein n=1 Tax=Erythrobacter rubeus TaxID=2760803 RepID=A0ABR8KNH0_9SPHN|nr:serine hydrolase domain-containing protein [Erythrobacter rubeus]MBD2840832.1 beta-lactamase family protein [Erythrobacter rubeus]
MTFRLIAALLLILPMTAHAAEPVPATVVIAFDREGVRPIIVEGVADRESGREVEANDPVRIASISKLIMALATLRLVDEGKVALDADVSDYLGWQVRSPNFPDAKVTLAQLLSHRSGLRDRAGYVIPLGESLQEKLAEPEAWYADAPPGEAPFEYANLGSPVVATVLEAATGESYDAIVERTVFGPLGVEGCLNWIGCSEEQVKRAVVLYRDTGEIARDDPADLPPNCTVPVAEDSECSLENYVPGTNASVFSPQGGVRIGMMDLAKIGQQFLKSVDDNFLTDETTMALFFSIFERHEGQDFFCSYGLALQSIDNSSGRCEDNLFPNGRIRIGHAGEAYGLRSGLWMDVRAGTGIAYFTTAVPPRQSAEDEGGFDPREIALMERAQRLLSEQSGD